MHFQSTRPMAFSILWFSEIRGEKEKKRAMFLQRKSIIFAYGKSAFQNRQLIIRPRIYNQAAM